MVPMGPEAGGFSAMVLNETRRRLGSFQLCAPCTCCGGSRGACVLSPCCYAINCNIPTAPSASAPSPPSPATASAATSEYCSKESNAALAMTVK
ncbi:hypothetical protein GUJ93_ZPchr0115g2740 [Zizania palustris]|uniref:DUF7866 domain-containing protein n=1 Tax=Zizania palustris TaxID=103762 RepID=A0A8J5R1E9_ZIZPA|nr:hypothetical protein GUJ93_ZPchr0115g2740 [Zizania palustris]